MSQNISSRTRSCSRGHTSTVIPKESGSTNNCKPPRKTRKSSKRKIVTDESEANLKAKQIRLNNNSHVVTVPESLSSYADNQTVEAAPSTVAEEDEIIVTNGDEALIFISDSEYETDVNVESDVIYVKTSEARRNVASVMVSDSDCEEVATGKKSDAIHVKTSVARRNVASVMVSDSDCEEVATTGINTLMTQPISGSKAATENETSIMVHNFGADVVTLNDSSSESSFSDETFNRSAIQTSTPKCETCSTGAKANDVSLASQISDVSSISLAPTNNGIKETDPGCTISANVKKVFIQRRTNRKRFAKKRQTKKSQANVFSSDRNLRSSNYHKKSFFHRNRKSFNQRNYLRPNHKVMQDNNNNKFYNKRSTAAFAKAIHNNPCNSAVRTKDALTKTIHTNPCSSKSKIIAPTRAYHTANHGNYRNATQSNVRTKRKVLIDASNVAFAHSSSKKEFSVRGIEIALNYFLRMGHEVKAVVPQFRLKHSNSTNSYLLEKLKKEDKLIITPCKSLSGGSLVSYDDRIILQLAHENDAVVISNDNFRDLFHEKQEYRNIIKSRVIGYTFYQNCFVIPNDPYGRNGPSSNEILTKPV